MSQTITNRLPPNINLAAGLISVAAWLIRHFRASTSVRISQRPLNPGDQPLSVVSP